MIRGINKHIGVDESNQLIKRVFVERFGDKRVVNVTTIRKTDNIQHLFRKKEAYKQKVD